MPRVAGEKPETYIKYPRFDSFPGGGGGGGTQIWFRRECAAEAAKPVPISFMPRNLPEKYRTQLNFSQKSVERHTPICR